MRPETRWTTRAPRSDDGMALITVIMVMMLVSVLMVGFVSAIVADNRSSGLDHDQTQAYAATHAGLEKLTSDLSALFTQDFSPSTAQINALLANKPTVTGFQYLQPDGTSGYLITYLPDANGNPAPEDPLGSTISHGPYQGFKGIITPYELTVTARSQGGAEVRMKRTLQTIAVPVFQFGMFSENDLSFHAGPDFNFGGRVHTNANLYVAQGDGATLTLSDRVTAVGQVIRTNLSNGFDTSSNYTGTVRVATTIMANPANNVYRNLARTEGSLVGTIGSAVNSAWTNLSIGTYNSNIRNGTPNGGTGAKRLDLPLVSQGAQPVDLIRRPAQNSNENTAAPLIYQQRYFSQAALRILLSDTVADITNLPTIAAGAPVPLDGAVATAAQYGPPGTAIPNAGGVVPPMAASPGPLTVTTNGTTTALVPPATVTINTSTSTLPFDPVLKVGATTVTCTGKTANSFTGCVGTPVAILGTAVTSNYGAATVTTAAVVLNAATIPVTNNSTGAFVPAPFWFDDYIVSCTGYTSTSFTGCSGLSVAESGNIPSNTVLTSAALSTAGEPLLNGFIKIEKQTLAGVWTDVTTEILNLGIADRNQNGTICADPNPNAVIRLQRLRDNGGVAACNYAASTRSIDYWPNALYDTREGLQRDSTPTGDTTIAMGGVMHYVALDVNNLRRWFAGNIGATGNTAKNDNGYIVYFSDRRNNRNAANVETGEYGFEDVVNPADVNGVPDGALQTGEDSGGLDAAGKPMVGGNGLLETYGQTPRNLPAGAALPYTAAGRPWLSTVGGVAITAGHAATNRPILFRRALKLVDAAIVGGVSSLPQGFTVASENPVYIQGNYNTDAAGNTLANPHMPSAVIADAVTLLSVNWSDMQSFLTPNNPGARNAATTGYRVAIVGGKNPTFPRPGAWASDNDFGTDGGAHNFLRYLEGWGGATLNYRGSIVSFYYARQATGTYKCCTNVYGAPTRGYNFDSDFLTPSLLPPGTPMFRDINTLTFRQLLRPNQ